MGDKKTPTSGRSGLPIVLGVSGHRNIPDEDRTSVVADLRTEIENLRRKYPHTPFVAISAIAEGADRWFAHAMLEMSIPLYVVLPLAAEEYKKDFEKQESKDEFDELCKKACVVSTLDQDDPFLPAIDPAYHRELQYARVGVYMAQRCHILFALWDGDPNAKGLGGTAQVVQFHLYGRIQDFKSPHQPDSPILQSDPSIWLKATTPMDLLDDPDVGCVCHIKVRRGSDTPLPSGMSRIVWKRAGKKKHPDTDTAPTDPLLTELDKFNKELSERPGAEEDAQAPTQTMADIDKFATCSMTDTRKFLPPVIALMILSYAIPELLQGVLPEWASLLWQLATQAAIWGLVLRARHHRSGNNKQAIERRALTEGLRVQGWWSKAGIRDAVALRYLRHDHKDLGWVHRALLGSALPVAGSEPNLARATTPEDIAKVTENWVEGQHEYFESKAENLERTSRVGKVATVLYFVGFAAGFIALVFLLLHTDRIAQGWFVHGFSIANGLLPIVAIYLFTWMRFAGLNEDLGDYTRQRDIFAAAKKRLKNAQTTLAEQQAILHQLGMEALHENARWAHRHKSLDLEYTL